MLILRYQLTKFNRLVLCELGRRIALRRRSSSNDNAHGAPVPLVDFHG
jgi:hypothetical protein